jgi:hypothetical protein
MGSRFVPEASYVPARSLIRIATQVAQTGGGPVGGLLLVALSPSGAYLVSSAALVTAALLARFGLSPHPVTGATDGTALLRDFALADAAARITGPGLAIAGADLCGIVVVICMRPRSNEVPGRAPRTSKADRPAQSPITTTTAYASCQSNHNRIFSRRQALRVHILRRAVNEAISSPGQTHGHAPGGE